MTVVAIVVLAILFLFALVAMAVAYMAATDEGCGHDPDCGDTRC